MWIFTTVCYRNKFFFFNEFNPLARTNYFQNRTFESAPNLMVDIAKFVSTANEERANCIQILSNFNNIDNVRSYKSFTKYYGKSNLIKRLINYIMNEFRCSIT